VYVRNGLTLPACVSVSIVELYTHTLGGHRANCVRVLKCARRGYFLLMFLLEGEHRFVAPFAAQLSNLMRYVLTSARCRVQEQRAHPQPGTREPRPGQ
jgi:hypothetical protein